ncbi:cytochrome (ubi)quinol oxidase subunit III [Notoacmeibacter ruber]|uniref:Cytochrome bo(3) ubiquinol oxidase subunit 3 n=1 Tax=Notoacmeibacter ruber TaxID=2670375 RepID=A0A3L7JDK0_9HYPH|nr:cytochrome (ubi)quinol oxidase subunit III [Notoacmeibacter ruber]RLQ88385.1 cytochrome (ubi)quinol oxidase subunit III [Notoacmeibacter ruber]
MSQTLTQTELDQGSNQQHPGPEIARGDSETGREDETEVFGFWAFMMSDAIIFTLLFATFGVLRQGLAGGPGPRELFSLPLTAAETAALLTSSVTFGVASLGLQAERPGRAIFWLAITFVLGAIFLGLELYEFHDIFSKGGTPQTSGFLSAWFTLLATHGLHVTFGMGWLILIVVQLILYGTEAQVGQRMLRLGIFWHFLDVVWVGIFSIVYLGTLA